MPHPHSAQNNVKVGAEGLHVLLVPGPVLVLRGQRAQFPVSGHVSRNRPPSPALPLGARATSRPFRRWSGVLQCAKQIRRPEKSAGLRAAAQRTQVITYQFLRRSTPTWEERIFHSVPTPPGGQTPAPLGHREPAALGLSLDALGLACARCSLLWPIFSFFLPSRARATAHGPQGSQVRRFWRSPLAFCIRPSRVWDGQQGWGFGPR